MSAAAEVTRPVDESSTNLLDVSGLNVGYQMVGQEPVDVVRDISFSVGRGSVIGLVGESGSGKSTTALACLGLTKVNGHIGGGSVRLDGRELLGLPQREWEKVRGGEIGLVTQNPRASLHPTMRVGDQIAAVYRSHTGCTKDEAKERVLQLLRLVGINDPERRVRAFPDELSGGMAQRIVIAMALSCSPRLTIADEPTSGLDVTVQAQILDDLVASVRKVGSGLLLVTQDLSIVANYCDEVYLMYAGEIVEHGDVATFFDQPAHPATLALLASQQRLVQPELALATLPIDLRNRPTGCQLAPRCPFAVPDCGRVHPDLEVFAPGHDVRCIRAEDVAATWQRLEEVEHAHG